MHKTIKQSARTVQIGIAHTSRPQDIRFCPACRQLSSEPLRLTDFALVPRLTLFGTWPIQDLIPVDQLARLASFTNALERKEG